MNKQVNLKQITLLLLFIFGCINLYAQDQFVTIQLRNASLKDVLKTIEKQTTYRFSYKSVVIDDKKDITISKTKASVSSVLDEVLSKKGLEFSIVSSKSIVISDKMEIRSNSKTSLNRISGVVKDQNGETIIGANVAIKGVNVGTITDINGTFSLDVPESSTLIISYIGYVTQDIKVEKQNIVVILREDSKSLDEVVVVGYGTQKKGNLTGAIASINSKEIITTTHSSLAQSLEGKVSGLQIRQNSGGPGDFDTNINIRGFGSPLYVIDGVPSGGASEFQRLNPNDIESISVLKDASAAIYGLNAGNGVILVTTKKGKKGKPQFSYSGVTGVQTLTDMPEMCNAAQWAELYNDSRVNIMLSDPTSVLGPAFTKEELEKWKVGGLGYESTNWYDMVIKKYAPQKQHNFSVRGGSDAVDYYISFGTYKEEGLLKSNDLNYNRYNLRSNLTVKLANNLTADINLSGRYDVKRSPGEFIWIYRGAFLALPTEKPYANNNTDYFAKVSDNNPLPLMDEDYAGYNQQKSKNLLTIASLTYKAPFLKGLELKGSFTYDTQIKMNKSVTKTYNVYTYDAVNDVYNATKINSPAKISNSNDDNNKVMIQAQTTYNNTFADAHTIGATLVYEQSQGFYRYSWLQREYDFYTNDQINQASINNQLTDGYESQSASVSLVGKFNYNYKSKYFIDFAFREDGTYRYASDNKWGFFPVISGAWRISEEKFIKNNIGFINNLKIRASYGKVGENAGEPFQYAFGYTTTGSGGYEMTDGSFTTGIAAPSITNENLTWYTSTITDFGLDLSLFNSKLNFEIDFYQRDREGLLATRNLSLPNTFGADLPDENLNSDRVRGLDFAITHKNKIGDFSYGISANLNYARTMKLYVERSAYRSSWDKWRNGNTYRWSDVVWGYDNIGQFQSLEEIYNSPVQDSKAGLLPGDYKYSDVNGDGLVNGSDMLPSFWNGTPKLHYGLTLDAQWKGFDINALFQGSGKYTIYFSGTFTNVLWGEYNTPAYFYDRWHLSDPYDLNSEWISGKWPATKTVNYNSNNVRESSVFRKDATYLRFKSMEIGYSVPTKLLNKIFLETCRFYINAHNLFTICDPFLKPFDPEKIEGAYSAGQNYPLTKSYNVGVNLTF